MNWRRGLLRLWIVVAVCWISAVGFHAYDVDIPPKFDPTKPYEEVGPAAWELYGSSDSNTSRDNPEMGAAGLPPALGNAPRRPCRHMDRRRVRARST